MRRDPSYSPAVTATRWSVTSSTGVPGDQGGRVAVGAEPQVREVEGVRKRGRVAVGGRVEVVVGDRHRANASLGADREALHQVGEVALGGAGRGHALVHLEDLGLGPVELVVLESGRTSARDRGHRSRPSAQRPRSETAALTASTMTSAPRAVDGVGIVQHLEPVLGHLLGFSSWPPNCAHRGEHAVSEVVEVARGEALVEGGGEHSGGYALLDRRDRGPAALSGVRDPAPRTRTGRRIRNERGGSQVE